MLAFKVNIFYFTSMKKIISFSVFYISILFLIENNAVAQTAISNNDQGTQSLIDLKDNFASYVGMNPKSEGLKGSPFIFDDMVKADLLLNNGKLHNQILINIHPENSEVYVQLKPNHIVVPDITSIEEVRLNEDSRVFKPVRLEKNIIIGEVLFENEEDLFIAQHIKKFEKAQVGGAYNTGSKYDEYIPFLKYFRISKSNGEVLEIKKNNSGLKKIAGSEWKKAKSFLDNNDLDFSNTEDAKKLFAFVVEEL
jgi:hypothetical protein